MFCDPGFYKALREQVIPILKTYSFIKIWHTGCATGEEVYSMAILLQEEGLSERTTIYATDFNQQALTRAREGIFSNDLIREYSSNYVRAGGKKDFSKYYTSSYNMAIMNQGLKKNIVWANHNLVTDAAFAEVHVILCRNVLIYFNRDLQDHVQQLFLNSLTHGGILCLGSKESLRLTEVADKYMDIDKKCRVLFNLISNAVKYSSRTPQPIVEITWERKNDEEVFTIKDNGAGFDMRYADKLFGVFQRLHTDYEFEGIGVGLALVKRIVTRHGGKVWADGKVNEGAAFYFTIPVG